VGPSFGSAAWLPPGTHNRKNLFRKNAKMNGNGKLPAQARISILRASSDFNACCTDAGDNE
jgi:hypothetical protein